MAGQNAPALRAISAGKGLRALCQRLVFFARKKLDETNIYI
jgi:hypothetical protein